MIYPQETVKTRFYLGGILGLFIFRVHCPNNVKKGILHACIFIMTIHSLLFLWQWRNYNHYREYRFSNIGNATLRLKGLYKSYGRNQDPISQNLPPVPYYFNVGARNLMSLLTRPASYKYFGSDILKKGGKIFSYPWIAFWLAGFIRGLSKADNKPIPFYFLLLVILYFMGATIGGAMWGADARFRVVMMPFIAIISSYGWTYLKIKRDRSR